MNKAVQIGLRVTPREVRALKRYAAAEGKTFADLVRGRVIAPALAFDPKQAVFALEDREKPMRATG